MLSGWINKGRISVDNSRHTEKATTTSKPQERDNIGTAWKGERKREQEHFSLCGKDSSSKIGTRASFGGKITVDGGGLEPPIFRLIALRSAD